ncbi:IclR family transcriptional regulator [Kibdelosporangium philippinense]|uniref:IclR family transcriptional regulator n=1 Tax=Kibdelosporangium philippinense TaxID=211113 RepID=A0ABS8ZTS6_9PSEU|nr:IclR family transcriptional regulator [Kibdelosporangium philippinense]MCE7010989.1 IclR family transcriptional regulator [Kibdelosporangium philippinense]
MPGPIQSIERAAAILRLLARGSGRLGIGEIAESLELAKGTAHGILRTLQGVGFVEQDKDSGKYQLGAALLHLGTSYLDVNELRSRAINWADALAARSGEAVRIGAPYEGRVLVVHHVFRPDDSLQTLDVGALLPLHATALGKVLLAYDTSLVASLRGSELESYTRRTLASPTAVKRALASVREAGWASELGEMTPGEAGIAAPIRGHGGIVVGALGISGAAERLCDPDGNPKATLLTYVRDAARAVSRDLGASRW